MRYSLLLVLGATLIGCGGGASDSLEESVPPGGEAGRGGQGGLSASGQGGAGSGQGGAGQSQGGAGNGQGGAGNGQGGASGASAGGGAGGSVGAVVCDFLLQTGAPVDIQTGLDKRPVHPQLAALGDGSVSLAYGLVQTEFPAPGPPTPPAPDLHFAVFPALGAWPSAPIAPTALSWEGQGDSVAFDASTASGAGFTVLSASSAGGVQVRSFDLATATAGAPAGVLPLGTAVRFFTTPGGPVALGGLSVEISPGQHFFRLARLAPGEPPQGIDEATGCATAPIVADLLPGEGGSSLLALSSSRPAGSCNNDNGANGPPTSVQLLTQTATPPQATLTSEFPLDQPLSLLRLLPRQVGAWLVLSTGVEGNQPLRMLSVVPGGFIGQQVVDLTEGAVIPTGPVVTSMSGDRVALAFVENGGQVPHLMLRSSTGQSSATTGVEAGLPGDLAVLSPAPDTILIAWTEQSSTTPRLRVARYRCEHAE